MKRCLSIFCVLALAAIMAGAQQRRPNIVLIFPDNLGWGEVGVTRLMGNLPRSESGIAKTQAWH